MLAGEAPNLSITISPFDEKYQYQVVDFFGDFDKTGFEAVKQRLEELSQNFKGKYLVFNLAGLNFINSEGIGYFMMLHTHLAKQQKEFVLTNIESHVKDVLSVIGLLSVFKTYDSLPAFVQKISTSPVS